ncbi:MAG: DUF4405 domain-containing protein [Anaeroplasma sp.]
MKKFRSIIDIAMTIFFIILMGYFATGNKIHEILGTITFILFIIHNILNIKWYKSIVKGKHNFQRTFHIIINLLLLIAMIGMIISGIMISSTVFSFLNIQTTMFGRRLHMASTSWGFVLMAIHVGLHLNSMMSKINKKMKNSTFEYVYYFMQVVLMGLGLYSFISLKLWEDMFLLNDFKFYDYNQNTIIFYLKYIGAILFIELVIYFIFKILNKFKSNRSRREKDR